MPHQPRGLALATAVLALLALPAASEAGPARALSPSVVAAADDRHGDCEVFVPAQQTFGQLPTPRTSPSIRLDVLVLTEKRLLQEVREDVTHAARSYAPLGIVLAPRYQLVKAVPDLDGDSQAYVDWLKSLFKGRRPAGSDVVYLATDRYIGAAGQADCISGIAQDDHAFAVGMTSMDGLVGVEVTGIDVPSIEPPVKDGGVLLIVHELGHLLGAHHHYGGACAHGRSAEDPSRPCDVMLTLAVQQTGLHFGPVNAAVVRDHAERFAR